MTKPDALKQAEERGYSKGYAAGKRRKAVLQRPEAQRAKERALWQRAMLAALPFAMVQSSWKRGETQINAMADRVSLAGNVADKVVDEAVKRGRI